MGRASNRKRLGSGFEGHRQKHLRAYESRSDRAAKAPFAPSVRPGVLYHYTKWPGLRGILASQELWATAHDAMDEGLGELRATDLVLTDVFAASKSGATTRAASLLQTFRDVYMDSPVAEHLTVYLTCLTNVRDRQLHWERFADYDGACLAFKLLIGDDEPLPLEYQGFTLARGLTEVVYDPGLTRERIAQGFRDVFREYEEFARTERRWSLAAEALKVATLDLVQVAGIAAIASKPERFLPEAEWRFTALPGDPLPASAESIDDQGRRFIRLRFRSPGRRLLLEEVIVCGTDPAAAIAQAAASLESAGYTGDKAPPIRVSDHCGKRAEK